MLLASRRLVVGRRAVLGRVGRVLVPVVVLVALLPGAARSAGPPHSAAAEVEAAPAYRVPLTGAFRIVRPFEAPTGPYGAGHRGVDLATVPGQSVLAAGGGTVAFAGTVAGRGVVVIAHADGVRTEYEPVTPQIRAGATVDPGQRIGVVSGSHGGCGAGRCLHWGARFGASYFDPMSLLRALGVVHLVPLASRHRSTSRTVDQARGWAWV